MATDADITKLRELVEVVVNDKADEDAKTNKANADAAAAAQAASVASQSQSDEVTASAKTASDLKAAFDFLSGLVTPPTLTP